MTDPGEKPSVDPGATLKPGSPDAGSVEVKELIATVSQLKEQVQGQSKIIAALTKEKEKKAEPVTPDPLTDRVKVLEEKDAKQAAITAKQKDREVLQALEKSLIDGGADPKQAPRFAKLIQIEHAKNIEVDDDFNVRYRETPEKATALDTWAAAFMQTEDGKVFLPVQRNPSVKTGAAGGTKPKLSKAQMQAGDFDIKTLKAGGYEIVD